MSDREALELQARLQTWGSAITISLITVAAIVMMGLKYQEYAQFGPAGIIVMLALAGTAIAMITHSTVPDARAARLALRRAQEQDR